MALPGVVILDDGSEIEFRDVDTSLSAKYSTPFSAVSATGEEITAPGPNLPIDKSHPKGMRTTTLDRYAGPDTYGANGKLEDIDAVHNRPDTDYPEFNVPDSRYSTIDKRAANEVDWETIDVTHSRPDTDYPDFEPAVYGVRRLARDAASNKQDGKKVTPNPYPDGTRLRIQRKVGTGSGIISALTGYGSDAKYMTVGQSLPQSWMPAGDSGSILQNGGINLGNAIAPIMGGLTAVTNVLARVAPIAGLVAKVNNLFFLKHASPLSKELPQPKYGPEYGLIEFRFPDGTTPGANNLYYVRMDLVKSEEHSTTATVFAHPVETGETVADHVMINPTAITMKFLVSNHSVRRLIAPPADGFGVNLGGYSNKISGVVNKLATAVANPVGAVAGLLRKEDKAAAAPPDKYQDWNWEDIRTWAEKTYQVLITVVEGGALCNVYTSIMKYEDMYMTEVSTVKDETIGDALIILCRFEQYRAAVSKEIEVTSLVNPRASSAAASKPNNTANAGALNPQALDRPTISPNIVPPDATYVQTNASVMNEQLRQERNMAILRGGILAGQEPTGQAPTFIVDNNTTQMNQFLNGSPNIGAVGNTSNWMRR